jgi:molybdenum cofactor cytidylyltransferase
VIFRSWPVAEVMGRVNAHTQRLPGRVIKKGAVLSVDDVAALQAEGIQTLFAAHLEETDIGEDDAARQVADAAAGRDVRCDRAATGRVNLFAEKPGVLRCDRVAIDAANAIHPDLTFATLPDYASVVEGEMVGTVKVISFAAPAKSVNEVTEAARRSISVAAFRPQTVVMISTTLPSLKPSVVTKTEGIFRRRLEKAGAELISHVQVPHEADALCDALGQIEADLIVIFGASAIIDRRDIVPAAIEAAGGAIRHFGMPVDPGNLLLLAELAGKPVLGAPGCARSPKENGFDWVIDRLLAGLPVEPADITGMGVGGLLMEIVSRPQPRAQIAQPQQAQAEHRVAALILAAGRGTRMGGPNKLMQEVGGKPMLAHSIEAAKASDAWAVLGVTGHEAAASAALFDAHGVTHVHNADYSAGLSSSLRVAIANLPSEVDAAIVLLGDMPQVTPAMIDTLIAAYDPINGAGIVVPTVKGKRGNPVLWGQAYFEALRMVQGDVGGRGLIGTHEEAVFEVEMNDPAIFRDIDTPEALAALRDEQG